MFQWMIIVVVKLVITSSASGGESKLNCLYSFTYPRYVNVPKDEEPDPRNTAIFDIETYRSPETGRDMIFVSTPRIYNEPVAAQVGVVTSPGRNKRRINLVPYPSYEYNNNGCDGLYSVYAIRVDECGRLWAVDNGHKNLYSISPEKVCPQKVVNIDINTDTVRNSIQIPEKYLLSCSTPGSFVVDIRNGKCDEAYIYVTDHVSNRILVLNYGAYLKGKPAWHWVQSRCYYPNPKWAALSSNNVTVSLMEAVIGITKGRIEKNKDRYVYFHATPSVTECRVKASVLQNRSLGFQTLSFYERYFEQLPNRRNRQTVKPAMTDNGIMFFGEIGENTETCWSDKNIYDRREMSTVIDEPEKLNIVMASTLNAENTKLFMLTTNMGNYLLRTQTSDEYNFKICVADVKEITKNTNCEQA